MKLDRKLGFWEVFCIASGAMISSGLFVLPGIAFAQSGPAMVVAYGLAALMAVPAAMSKAELASAMPRSGGSYFFIERSMGALPGTLAGFANWFSISLKSAFALIGIGAFTRLIWPGTDIWVVKTVAVACCVAFALLNIFSVKHAGRLQVVFVIALLAILTLFVGKGIGHVRHAPWAGFMDEGLGAVLATAGLVFVSFGGLTKVASVAGEVRNPGRNIPAGMFAALLVVGILYVSAVFVTAGVLDPTALHDKATGYINYTPLCTAAEAFMGRPGLIILAAAAMLAFTTTANSGIMTASRSPMAMSHDRLLPKWFRKLSPRFHTPQFSIVVTALFMIAIITTLSIVNLVKVASTMMLMLFLLNNLAVLIMRGSKIQNYRPLYRTPLFPWFQLGGVAMYLLLIVKMGAVPLLTTAAFAVLAVVWYVIYVRPRTSRESALLYMVRNALSMDMHRINLEDELRDIALERDEVTGDRFDKLIQDCDILDMPDAATAEELFEQVSEKLSPRLGIDKPTLMRLFQKREDESSTIIQPGLAIPHIIIEGKGKFDILPVRSKEGIRFPGHHRLIRIAFALVGSPDERNYHLRALMALANIVQEEDFTERWLDAPDSEGLRDIILLSRRAREA